ERANATASCTSVMVLFSTKYRAGPPTFIVVSGARATFSCTFMRVGPTIYDGTKKGRAAISGYDSVKNDEDYECFLEAARAIARLTCPLACFNALFAARRFTFAASMTSAIGRWLPAEVKASRARLVLTLAACSRMLTPRCTSFSFFRWT